MKRDAQLELARQIQSHVKNGSTALAPEEPLRTADIAMCAIADPTTMRRHDGASSSSSNNKSSVGDASGSWWPIEVLDAKHGAPLGLTLKAMSRLPAALSQVGASWIAATQRGRGSEGDAAGGGGCDIPPPGATATPLAAQLPPLPSASSPTTVGKRGVDDALPRGVSRVSRWYIAARVLRMLTVYGGAEFSSAAPAMTTTYRDLKCLNAAYAARREQFLARGETAAGEPENPFEHWVSKRPVVDFEVCREAAV